MSSKSNAASLIPLATATAAYAKANPADVSGILDRINAVMAVWQIDSDDDGSADSSIASDSDNSESESDSSDSESASSESESDSSDSSSSESESESDSSSSESESDSDDDTVTRVTAAPPAGGSASMFGVTAKPFTDEWVAQMRAKGYNVTVRHNVRNFSVTYY